MAVNNKLQIQINTLMEKNSDLEDKCVELSLALRKANG